MNVKKLIAALSQYPEDAEVYMVDPQEMTYTIVQVKYSKETNQIGIGPEKIEPGPAHVLQ